jgi:hypothetical protein
VESQKSKELSIDLKGVPDNEKNEKLEKFILETAGIAKENLKNLTDITR